MLLPSVWFFTWCLLVGNWLVWGDFFVCLGVFGWLVWGIFLLGFFFGVALGFCFVVVIVFFVLFFGFQGSIVEQIFPHVEVADSASWLTWKFKETLCYAANIQTDLHCISIHPVRKFPFRLCSHVVQRSSRNILLSCIIFTTDAVVLLEVRAESAQQRLAIAIRSGTICLSLLPTSSFFSQTMPYSCLDVPYPLLTPVLMRVHGKPEWQIPSPLCWVSFLCGASSWFAQRSAGSSAEVAAAGPYILSGRGGEEEAELSILGTAKFQLP